jgi:hypothetical protein
MRYVSVLLICLFAGCQYVNPFTPIIQIGIFWIEGEAHKYYDTDEKTMQVAVKAVLKELTLPIVHEQQYEGYYYILAGDKNKFKIKIRPVREKITKLSIRVDTFGDKPFAELIYRHVDKQPGVQQFTTLEHLNTAMDGRPRR